MTFFKFSSEVQIPLPRQISSELKSRMYVTFFICLTLWGDGSHENLKKFLLLLQVPSRLLEGSSAGGYGTML